MRLRPTTSLAIVALTLVTGCGSSSSGGTTDHTAGTDAGGGSGAQGGAGHSGTGGSNAGGGARSTQDAGSGGRTGAGGNQIGSGGRVEQTDGGHLGTGGTKVTGSCSFTSPPAAPDGADAGTTSESMIRAQWLELLDSLVGVYLRGDVLVYRGTLKANDNTSAIYAASGAPPQPDQSIAQGSALARLEYRASTSSDYASPLTAPAGDVAMLVLHGLPDGKHIDFSQAKSSLEQTETTMIGDESTFVRLQLSCTGCAPTLWGRPNAIDFDLTSNGTATVFQGIAGQGGHDVDVPLRMTATTSLMLASPCSITFDDLKVLDTIIGPNEGSADFGLRSFKREGDEMVFHTQGSINGGVTTGRCFLTTPYTIDLYVKVGDLASYGVRNLSLGMPHELCAP